MLHEPEKVFPPHVKTILMSQSDFSLPNHAPRCGAVPPLPPGGGADSRVGGAIDRSGSSGATTEPSMRLGLTTSPASRRERSSCQLLSSVRDARCENRTHHALGFLPPKGPAPAVRAARGPAAAGLTELPPRPQRGI